MKKTYVAPTCEVEYYELNTSIASNCDTIVSNGPEIGDYKACKEFEGIFGDEPVFRARSVSNVSFYEDVCSCYYSSSGNGYWTS